MQSAQQVERRQAGIPVYHSERQEADRIGVKLKTLQRWRYDRNGPPFHRIVGTIRYNPAEVDAWVQAQTALRLAGEAQGQVSESPVETTPERPANPARKYPRGPGDGVGAAA